MVSIKSRLYLSTAAGIALTLLVAISSYVGLEKYAASVDDLASDDMAVFEVLSNLREGNLNHRIYWREAVVAVLSEQSEQKMPFGNAVSRDKAIAVEQAMQKEVERLLAMKARLDREDGEMIDRLAAGTGALLNESKALADAVAAKAGFMEVAGRVVATRDREVNPVLEKYYRHKQEEVAEAVKATEALHGKVQFVIVAASLAAVAITLLAATIISRSIVSALGKAESSARTMALGDFRVLSNCKEHCAYGSAINCRREQCEIGQLNISLETMRNNLSQAIASVQAKAGEASGLAQSLASGAEQAAAASQNQAEQVQHVAAAIEELNVSISEIANAGGNVRHATVESSTKAGQGADATAGMCRKMDDIAAQANRSAHAVEALQESAQGIATFTQTVKEIADQTNLLALNAAIEAARAGEQGRGFAVVADEVRKLAERTGTTTQSINDLARRITHEVSGTIASIRDIERLAEEGKEAADLSASTLAHIQESAIRVQTVVAEITAASGEQKASADMSAQAMEKIATAAEESNAVIENVKTSAGEISEIATHLNKLAGQFKVAA